jgi:DNA-directed RNA polymerase specialized sigma24 family protein
MQNRIAARLRTLGLSVADREDVGQQVLEAYLTSAGKVRNPMAWVSLVAFRKGLKSKYEERTQLLLDEPRFDAREDLRLDVRRALEVVPPEMRELLTRRFLHGATIDELAREGFGSPSTLKRRLNRAVATIRRRTVGTEC